MVKLSFNHLILVTFALLLLTGSGSTWARARVVKVVWFGEETTLPNQDLDSGSSKEGAMTLELGSIEKEESSQSHNPSQNLIQCLAPGSVCINSRNCCGNYYCNLNIPTPRCVMKTVVWFGEETTLPNQDLDSGSSKEGAMTLELGSIEKEESSQSHNPSQNLIQCLAPGSVCINSRNCCGNYYCNLNIPTPRCVMKTVVWFGEETTLPNQDLDSGSSKEGAMTLELGSIEKEESSQSHNPSQNLIQCLAPGSVCINSRNCCGNYYCNLYMPTPRCVMKTKYAQVVAAN